MSQSRPSNLTYLEPPGSRSHECVRLWGGFRPDVRHPKTFDLGQLSERSLPLGAPSAPTCWVHLPSDPLKYPNMNQPGLPAVLVAAPPLTFPSFCPPIVSSSPPPSLPSPPLFSDYCLHHSALPVMVVHRDASGGAELVLGAEATPPPITPVRDAIKWGVRVQSAAKWWKQAPPRSIWTPDCTVNPSSHTPCPPLAILQAPKRVLMAGDASPYTALSYTHIFIPLKALSSARAAPQLKPRPLLPTFRLPSV